jgi:hypothetical protein
MTVAQLVVAWNDPACDGEQFVAWNYFGCLL